MVLRGVRLLLLLLLDDNRLKRTSGLEEEQLKGAVVVAAATCFEKRAKKARWATKVNGQAEGQISGGTVLSECLLLLSC